MDVVLWLLAPLAIPIILLAISVVGLNSLVQVGVANEGSENVLEKRSRLGRVRVERVGDQWTFMVGYVHDNRAGRGHTSPKTASL